MNPIGLAFSMPLMTSTRQLPQSDSPWQLMTLLMPGYRSDAGPQRLSAQVRAVGHLDFFFLVDEFDDRHQALRYDPVRRMGGNS